MKKQNQFFFMLSFLLLILSAAYLGKGFTYTIINEGEGDLKRRWCEQHYVLRGQNPYDVRARERAETRGEKFEGTSRDSDPDPELGIPYDVDYPPWTYLVGALLFWPNHRFVTAWYSLWNILGLVVIGTWVSRMAGDCSRAARLFLLASVMAFGSFCTTVGAGNFGIIVLAMLILSYEFGESRQPTWSGLALGISLLKPTISGPFLLAHLVKRDFRALVAAGSYLVIASLVVWGLTKTDPLEMIGQMLHASQDYVRVAFGPLNLALMMPVSYRTAVLGTAGFIAGSGLLVMFVFRERPQLTLYAIAAVTARLWTYHLEHSNSVLLFLLIALWRQAVVRPRLATILAFGAVAFTLYLPAKVAELRPVQYLQYCVWITGLVILLVAERKEGFAAVQGGCVHKSFAGNEIKN